MEKNNSNITISLGSIPVLLTIIFAALRITNVVDWDLIIIFLPLIIDVGLGLLVLLIFVVAYIIQQININRSIKQANIEREKRRQEYAEELAKYEQERNASLISGESNEDL